MHARVVTGQYQLGTLEDAARMYSDLYLPAAEQQQGFKGALFLTDPDTHNAISISLWETEADMKASEANGFLQEQLAKFAHMFTGSLAQASYEVSVRT